MDWSRTKTILIFAFLILNVFLGYQLYLSKFQLGLESDTAQNMQWEMENFLAKQNITLKMDIPQETPELNHLYVEYVTSSIDGRELLEQKSYLETTTLVSTFLNPIEIRDPKSPKDVLNLLQDKVKHLEQYKEDVRWSLEYPNYWQMHDGLPMFVAPLSFQIEGNQIKGYRQTYLLVRNQGSGRKIISAYTALSSLIEKEMIKSGETIDSISLGYYGNKYDADIQVLAPVWRFKHGDKVDYVNGFHGIIENPANQ
ncbi:two-component system regulatory protein YycI [Brevibacillus daliensis]|uniref:two-component system regulatory protein YycI n=1 Tax=Brevibacillus daliensis TaxID=2892995 RepID=UPI001E5D7911|nr:two-component system regulatory protein YycI [Brevibacillus daliensis]